MPSRFWRASGNALLPSRNVLGPAASSWTPSSLGANLAWWAEPKPANLTKLGGGTPVDGDQVSAITDLSGNSISLSQGTSANCPVYHTDGTHYWLTLDGTNDTLLSSGFVNVHDASGQHTAFSTVNPSSATGVQSVLDNDSGLNSRVSQFLRTNAGTLESLAFNTSGTAFVDTGPSVGSGTVHVLSETTSTSAVEAFVDGTSSGGSTAITGTLQTATETLTLGSSRSGQYYNGNWYGGFIAKGVMGSTDLASAQTYMRALAP